MFTFTTFVIVCILSKRAIKQWYYMQSKMTLYFIQYGNLKIVYILVFKKILSIPVHNVQFLPIETSRKSTFNIHVRTSAFVLFQKKIIKNNHTCKSLVLEEIDLVFPVVIGPQTFHRICGSSLRHNLHFFQQLDISPTCNPWLTLKMQKPYNHVTSKYNVHVYRNHARHVTSFFNWICSVFLPPVTCPSFLKLNSRNLANLLELSFMTVFAFPKLSNRGFTW